MTARKRTLPPPSKLPPVRRTRGGQPGNQNALTNGRFTHEMRDLKAAVWAHTRRGNALIEEARKLFPAQFRQRRRRNRGDGRDDATPSLPS